MIKNIIFLGPPGSGKGTQAKNLADTLGYFYFGTGELMRQESKKNTDIGKKFQEVWDRGKGELIQDELVQEFVDQEIGLFDLHDGIVFDGFPRTVSQSKHLENILSARKKSFWVFNLVVSDKSIIERMQTRRVCEDCGKTFFQADAQGIRICTKCGGKLVHRQEDRSDILQKRIDVYERQTKPLIDYYQNGGHLINIDGEQHIEDVEKEIIREINERD